MKDTLKRMLSALLVCAMLVSMVPAAFAEEIGQTETATTEAVVSAEPAQISEVETEATEEVATISVEEITSVSDIPAEATEEATEATEEVTEATEEVTEATEEATEATEEATEATEEATEATEEVTEATEEATEATEETTEATEETTETTEETTEATEETTEATEEATEPTEEILVEDELTDEALLAAAPTGEHMTAAGMKIISKTVNNVAPGVTYDSLIIRNKSNQQNMGILTKVDLSQSVKLKASYNGYYTKGSTAANRAAASKSLKWGFQSTTGQAAAYGSIADAEGTVVMATNADYFNMGTGEPTGYLIMEGNAIKTKGEPYFAILKDGTAVIRDAGTDHSDVVEAISGPFYLVKDGKSVAPVDLGLMPRNSIGITADGDVVFYQNDGRQAPKSVGMTLDEVASVLLDAGCVTALYMDGGGSATVAARKEGAASLEIINSPSDGHEREVSSAMLIVSTAKATGEFDHAAITPNDDLYTPKSQIQFAATGVDSAGTPVAIPADVTWALADDCADMGTIDATGLFTANEKTGVVTVEMRQNGQCVGSAFVEIVSPDLITFENDEVSLGFEETTDFKLVVRYQDRDVHYKVGDIIWTTTNDKMGTFNGNEFTASDGESLNGEVTATSAFDAEVKGTIKVIVGMLPTIVWDFEDVINEDGTVTDAADYYVKSEENPDGILSTKNYGRGGKQSIEIVSIDDGEPVRFGEKSLKLNFDFTQCGAVTEGAEIGIPYTTTIPGSPTGIGVWVYAPEGVGVTWEGDGTQAGFWLRGYIKDSSTGGAVPYDFTLEPKAITAEMAAAGVQPGIYWEGWKYLEADLTHLQAPYSILSGCALRLMFVNGTKMGTRTANSIYFDNFQFVYGTNVDDIDEPKVDTITVNNKELTNGTKLTEGKFSLRTTFSDVQNKYTSGIDANTVRIYIDGVNVVGNDHYSFALNANDGYAEVYDLELLDGAHSVTVSMRDNFGNDTSETRYFTVKAGSPAPDVVVVPAEDSAILSDTVSLEVRSTDTIVTKIENTIRLSNRFPAPTVTFADDYEGTYTYDKNKNTLSLSATLKETAVAPMSETYEKLIATITVEVPADLTENDTFLYEVKSGSYTTADGKQQTYSASAETMPVGAEISISCDPILVGGPKGILKVTDRDGKPVAGAKIYLAADDTEIGETDANGQWETDYFSAAVATIAVYAKNAEGMPSFMYNVISYAGSAADTAPSKIQFNTVTDPATQKAISWISSPLTAGAQSIRYRVEGTETWVSTEAETKLLTFTTGSNMAANINAITLTGLDPATTYEYQVGTGDLWSEIATLSTAPASSDSTKFFVMADIQAADQSNVEKLIGTIKADGYDFGIQTGDAIDSVTNYAEVVNVIDLLGQDMLDDMNMIRVLGNHEYYGDMEGKLVSALYDIENTAAGTGYSVTYGDVYIATIHFTNTVAELDAAMAWLEQDAKASDATWKVLALHQPPYYTNAVGGNGPINAAVPAVCEAAGIDVVFSGHDHSLTRTNQLTGGEIDEENGVLYYIGGSSGEKSYPVSSQSIFDYEKIFALATVDFNATYIGVEADDLKMTLKIYDVMADGTKAQVDSYTLYTEMGACDRDGHVLDEAVYDRAIGKVICNACGMAVDPVAANYTDWATDKETGRKMYLISGEPQTGAFIFGEDTYYFDDEGVALHGKVEWEEVEMEFDNGTVVGGHTGFVTKKDGKLYHYVNGAMTHGWLQDQGDWYYMSQKTGEALVGKCIIPDDSEALFRNARYDFAEDGKLVGSYFSKHGYFFWAGEPVLTSFVKNAGDPDPDAWYGTNEIGHFVTDGSDAETVKYTMDGVVYVFDNSNGKLLEGGFATEEGKLYYYWAGEPVNDGWFELDGEKYYAFEDGQLATGSHVIDGEAYMFNSLGMLVTDGVILTAVPNKDNTEMMIEVSNTERVYKMRLAVWPAGTNQNLTIQWFEAERNEDNAWVVEIPLCIYNRAGLYSIHAYATADGRENLLVTSTFETPDAVDHEYVNDICKICGGVRPYEMSIYRLYNPYTLEHLLTGDAAERDNLLSVGWTLDGVAWNAPNTGDPVYRLYNTADDWHTYSADKAEVDAMVAQGWVVDGVVCFSAKTNDARPVYRLFNPYEQKNYHMLTASAAEKEFLEGLGWKVDGVAWQCLAN